MKTFWLVVMAALAPGCVLTNPTDPYAGMGRGGRPCLGGGPQSTTTQPVQGPLTLAEAVRVAMANNPEVAAVSHEVEAAAAQRDFAGGQRLPNLHAVGGYNHYMDMLVPMAIAVIGGLLYSLLLTLLFLPAAYGLAVRKRPTGMPADETLAVESAIAE
jgi:hypothetical protein